MALKTPTQLAEASGYMHKLSVPGDTPFKAEHAAADVLHGWTLYEKTYGEPVMLEEEDYALAVEAAKTGEVYEPACKRKPRVYDKDGLSVVELVKPESVLAAEEEAKGEASVTVRDEEGSN